MATVSSFEELEVWQSGRTLVSEIYRLTQTGNFSRDFCLRDQLRRAAVSIISNIAEGFERGGNREFAHFLYLAKASVGEVRAQLYIALDLSYLTKPDFDRLSGRTQSLSKQIAAFIRYLEGTPLKSRTRTPQRAEIRTSNQQPATNNQRP